MIVAIGVTVVGLSLTPMEQAQAAVVQWGTSSGTMPNYQRTVNGDFVMTGNGVLACGTAIQGNVGTCNNLHNSVFTGTNAAQNVNDNFTMLNNNSAGGFTTNSSTGVLTIPNGASVVKAVLSWSANTGDYTGTAGVSCRSGTGSLATLPAGSTTGYLSQPAQLRIGNGAITSVAPSGVLVDTVGTPNALYYSASADVTASFTAAGTGSDLAISAGNLWTPTGAGCYAGWSMMVVYDFGTYIVGNTDSTPHRVIFYEGHVRENAGEAPLTVGFTGFTANGPGTRAGFTLFEGDRNITGDIAEYARAGSTTYAQIPNSAGATGNLGIGRAVGSVRYFDTGNATPFTNQSVDVATSALSNVVAGDSAVSLRMSTAGDSYLLRNAVLSVPVAGIQIVKTFNGTADTQSKTSTERATFSITITNTGAGALENVVVTDDQANCARSAAQNGTLAVLASITYTCTATAVTTADYVSTASVTATTAVGGFLATDDDSTEVLLSAIGLTKTSALAAGATGRAGDILTYTFVVTNTGSAPLTGVAITDPLVGLSALTYSWPGAAGTLLKGQRATATATYVLKQSDVDSGSIPNTASTVGTDNDGGARPTATATLTTPITPAPTLAVTKTGTLAAGGSGRVGDVINYSFTVRNTGNVTLTNGTLVDPLPGLSPPVITWPTSTAGTLAPGATATATATYRITQADVDAGSVVNTSTATGRTPAGATVSQASPASVFPTAASSPSLVTTKSAVVGGTGAVGNVITYSFSARNSGNVTLRSVAITDPLAGLSALTYTWPGAVGTLAPGQTATATATYTITQADVDAGSVRNTATASGTPPTGAAVTAPSPLVTSQTAASAPAVVLSKSGALAAGSTGVAGNTVNYSFSLRNSGNVTLTGVAITDPLSGLSALVYTWPGTPGTLAPGQTVTATATYALKQSDVDAGAVANTATGAGTPPSGAAVSQQRSATVPVTAAPALTVTKSGSAPAPVAVGSVATYTFVARNSGNVTLSQVAIADPLPGLSALSYTWPGVVGTLTPGQSVTATATYTVRQSDVDAGAVRNTATASGRSPAGVVATATSAQSTIPTVAASPSIVTTKSGVATGSAGVGATVTYSFSARNSGNVTLTGVTISDPLAGLSAINYGTWPSGVSGTLAPGQTITATAIRTITQADVDAGVIRNTATSRGTPPTGAAVTSASPESTITTAAAAPSASFSKSAALAPGATGVAGNRVDYSFSSTNTGNVTLTGVAITDPLAGLSALTYAWPGTAGTLAPGQTVTATATYILKQTDVDAGSVANTATLAATAARGAALSIQRSATVPVTASPALIVTKSGSAAGTAAVGNVITYSFSARNTGNVTLTQVAIADPRPGVSALTYTWPGTAGSLAPGQTVTATATYTITQADVDAGSVRNTATASGRTPANVLTTATSPQSTVTTAASAPSLVTTKSAAVGGTGAVGNVITYSFSTRNSGNVTLTGVAITDPLTGLSALNYTWPGTVGTLAPGQTVTATATYTITQTDVDAGAVRNTATSTGTPPTGPTVTRASGLVTTPTAASAPSVVLSKSGALAAGSAGIAGNIVNYSFSLRNSGNVTLTGVAITDPLVGLSALTYTWPGTAGTLAPNQTVTATATYALKQSDVDAGAVANTATGTGTPPTGAAVSQQRSATVPVTATPAITVSKTGVIATGTGIAGDRIDYSFVLRNTGNVTVSQVALVDSKAGVSVPVISWPGATGVLAPNQQATATATYTITQADVDAGIVRNTATLSGRSPAGAAVTATSPESLVATAASAPALTTTKTGRASGTAGVGDVITYSFRATNSGNVTLTGVAVADPLPGLSALSYTWPGVSGTLAPGQSATATASYTIRQSDVDGGAVRNIATSSGTPPTGAAVAAPSPQSTVVTAASAPSVALTKTGALAAGSTGIAGNTVNYTFSLRNSGNVTLTGVAVSDPLTGLSALTYTWPGTPGTLAPNQTVTATATYSLKQSDVDAGSVANTATGTGTPPTGAAVTQQRSATVPITRTPSLVVTKVGSSPAPVVVGSVVTYAFTVRNAGNVTLTQVSLADSKAGVSTPVVSWPGTVGTLLPGTTATATATYTVTQADVDAGSVKNTATASGTSPTGAAITADSAESTVTTVTPAPAIVTTKSGSAAAPASVGSVITYSFSARNAGNVTLRAVSIADPLPGLSALAYSWPVAVGTLAPGQIVTATATYTITQADVDAGAVRNTATSTGTPPTGPAVTGASPQSTVAIAASSPSIVVAKTGVLAAGSTGVAGDTVNYGFSLRNSGNVTLTGVTLSDPLPGLSALAPTWPGTPGTLAPGQTVTATATYVLRQTDVDAGSVANTVSGTAKPPTGANVTGSASRTVPITAGPAVTVTKTGTLATGTGVAGDRIDYSFVLRNTGNVTISQLVLIDSKPGLTTPVVAWPAATGVLTPNQQTTATASYTITQADVDAGIVRNTATLTGRSPAGATVSAQSAESQVATATGVARLTTTKTGVIAPTEAGNAGDSVIFSITSRNTGNVTLTGVTISDSLAGLSALSYTWPGTAGVLAPNQAVTATATYRLTQADVDSGSVSNVATATGLPPTGPAVTGVSPTATVATAASAPTTAFTKTAALAAGSTGIAGNTVNYSFSLRNTGNVTLTAVSISDPLPRLSALTYSWPGIAGTLAPGQLVTATATYTLVQADVDAGSVANTATSTGTPPTGAAITRTSPATVTLAAAPALAVTKSGSIVSPGTGIAGDTIAYAFTVRNTGNVTLTAVTLTDSKAGVSTPVISWPGTAGTLAPGATATATATYTLTQADVDAGTVRNTATANGTPPTGAPIAASSAPSVVQTIAASPSITTSKSGVASGTGARGDTITYSFSARNSGTVTLTGVTIADPLVGLSPLTYTWQGTVGTLAPGQVVTATATYTITQADVDAGAVRNTATSTGTPPTGPAVTGASPQSTVSTVASAPSVVQSKSVALAADATGIAGDTVEYAFSLRNSGNVTLTSVTIADPHPGLSALAFTWPVTAGTLAPGETVSATATYVLTQADVDAGSVANTATGSGAPPTGARASNSASATLPLATRSSLSVSKTGTLATGTGLAGDRIDYAFTITNTGTVTVSGITLTDSKAGVSTPVIGWTGPVGVLAPGASVQATANYLITQADVDSGGVVNIATTAGRAPGGAAVTATSPTSTVPTASAVPAVTTSKTGAFVGSGTGVVGDIVEYTFVTTNAGNVTLTRVAVSDPLAGLSPVIYGTWPGVVGTLLPGQSVSSSARHTLTQADVDAGVIRNTATSTGTPPTGPAVTGASAEVVTPTVAATPAIVATKSAALAPGARGIAGEFVDYSFTVRNAGNVTLTGVTLTDPLVGLSAIAIAWPGAVGVLSPGQTATAVARYTLTQADVDAGGVANTATASGTPPVGAAVTSTAAATVPITSGPALAVTKSGAIVAPGTGVAGDTVRFTIAARNTGNVTLTGVVVDDSLPGISTLTYTWPGVAGTLRPGQTVQATGTYTLLQADVDRGTVVNTATTTATPPTGAAITESSPPATVRLAVAGAAIDTTKTGAVTTGTGGVGDTVTFTIVTANRGNVTLTGVTITDSLAGLSALTSTWPGPVGTLAPGQQVVSTGAYLLTQTDVDAGSVSNTATSTGTPPTGPVVTDDSLVATVPTDAARVEVAATHTGALAGGATGIAGDRIDWSYSFTNNGNVTLTGVTIVDPQLGQFDFAYSWPDPARPGVLLPGQTATATSKYLLTQADVDAGAVTTVGTGSGTAPSGARASTPAPATVSVTPGPRLTISKSGALAAGDTGVAGDSVDFSFTLVNTGNVTLGQLAITDSLAGVTPPVIAWPTASRSLAPGESVQATASYLVSQADVDRGSVVNTASASASPPTGPRTSATSNSVTVALAAPAPALTTVKVGTATGSAALGDGIGYTFTITNTGNVTLTGVALTDTLPGLTVPAITWPGTIGTLAPGQVATATASYGIVQSDVDRGSVTNVATATGTSPGGITATASSGPSVVSTVAADPTATLVKSGALAAGAVAAAGSTTEYSFVFRNTGNVTLTGVTLTDPLAGLSGIQPTWPGPAGVLAPGQSVTGTATRVLTQQDVDAGSVANTATATAVSAQGGTLSRTAPATIPLAGTPALSAVKTGVLRSAAAGVGALVDYTFTIRNAGTLTLTDVTLDDTLPGLSTPAITWPTAIDGRLAPGQIATATANYTLTQADVDSGVVVNTATVSGAPPTGPRTTASSNRSEVLTAPAAPSIEATKSAAVIGVGRLGETVRYTLTAKNTGNVTLTGVTLADPLPGLGALTYGAWAGAVGTLAPGASVSATADYVLTQADIDKGAVANTASATGTPPTGPAVTDDSPELRTTTEGSRPSVTITHTGALAPGSKGIAGNQVDWAYSFTNTGNVTLSGVSLADPQLNQFDFTYTWPDPQNPTVLLPGQTVTATSKYLLTQADVDAGAVTSVVTGTGTPPTGAAVTAAAPATVTVTAGPALTVTKAGVIRSPGNGEAGSVIDYAFEISNTGNVTLTLVQLVDALGGVSEPAILWPGTPGTLLPGATATATAEYTITQADVDAGTVFNTATATGKPPTGADVSASSAQSIVSTAAARPSLATTKSSVVGAAGAVGDTITFTITSRNDGNVSLSGVTLSDPREGLSPLVYGPWPGAVAGRLQPGESITATALYTITQGDVDAGSVLNTATSRGTSPGGVIVSDASDELVSSTQPIASSISVTHTGALAPGSTGVAGDAVRWAYSLTNTGNTTLSAVSLVDPRPGQFDFTYSWPGVVGSLAPGETVTATSGYLLTQADVDAGAVTTTVTGRAQPPRGAELVEVAPATVAVGATPVLTVVKTGELRAGGALGDTIDYSFVLSNGGNVSISDVTLTDTLVGLSTPELTWPTATTGLLAPGESATGTARYVLTQADVDAGIVVNTATADGLSPRGDPVTSAAARAETATAAADPVLRTLKSGAFAQGATGRIGDTVTYSLSAENTGTVTLTGVTITDPLPRLSPLTFAWPGDVGVLAPGDIVTATATYVLDQADVDAGSVRNTATSSGVTLQGAPVADASPQSVVLTAAAAPSITVTHGGALAAGAAGRTGDRVDWTYSLTNTGTVTLTAVTLVDPQPGQFGFTPVWPGTPGILAPGETVTATSSYLLTQRDVDAGAVTTTVAGSAAPPTGAAVTASAPATVVIAPAADLAITITGTPRADAGVGDLIDYEIRAVNTGSVTLTALLFGQQLAGVTNVVVTWPGANRVLAPGETGIARGTYTVTQADVDAGFVANRGSIRGTLPDGSTVARTSDIVSVPTPTAAPAITAVKTGVVIGGGLGEVGDVIRYSIALRNAGNVTLTGVTVSDPLPGLTAPSIVWPGATGTLAPGQTATATATYAITQDDVNAGQVANTATATGTPPTGPAVTGVSGAVVVQTVTAAAAVVVIDSGTLAPGATGIAGDTIVWTYTLTNTGNVTLFESTLTDRLGDVSDPVYAWPGEPGVLQPGESVTATATYILKQSDVDAGAVSSIVRSEAVAPDGETVFDEDSATVPITAAPVLTVLQRAAVESPGIGAVGDIIRFEVTVTNDGNVTITNGRPVIDLVGTFDVVIDWPDPTKPGTLPAGESLQGSARYRITQADVDRGFVVNVVDVQGTTPRGDLVRGASNSVTVPTVLSTPSISTSKTGSVSGQGLLGDTVTYTIVTTNTGNVTLSGVTVADPKQGLSPISTGPWPTATAGVLAPGASVVSTATYVLTQTDIDRGAVENIAASTGTPPSGDAVSGLSPINSVATAPSAPQISVVKSGTVPAGAPVVGTPVTWNYGLTNSGTVTLTGVVLTDPLSGPSPITFSWPGDVGVLAPGQTVTATSTYPVTQADIDAGSVTSSVTGTGTPPSGADVTRTAPATVTLTASPSIALVQTAAITAPGTGVLGDTIDYVFDVTNTGNTTLTVVGLFESNPRLADPSITWPGAPGTLAPGESARGTVRYTITQADVDAGTVSNTETAAARAPSGAPVSAATPGSVVTLAAVSPSITTTKTGTTLAGENGVGDIVSYVFTVENTGTVTLTDVTLADPLAGLSAPIITWPGDVGVLAPGERATATATVSITQADVNTGSVVNIATSTGTSPAGVVVTGASPQSVVPTETAAPSIIVTDSGTLAPGATGVAGDRVLWTYTLRNDGNVTVTGAAIVDALPGVSAPVFVWPGAVGVLEPGQTVTATASSVLSQTDVDAGSIVSVITGGGRTIAGQDLSRSASATVLIAPAPALIVAQQARIEAPGIGAVGDIIRFDVTVTNTGNVTITQGRPVIDLPNVFDIVINWPNPDAVGTLRAGESLTASARYAITQADVDRGFVVNSVDVEGRSPQGALVDGVSNEITIATVRPAPTLVATKSAVVGGAGRVGDTVSYTLTARNTGNVTLDGVQISDPLVGLTPLQYGTWPSGTVGRLAPGQSVTATAEFVIDQASFDAGEVVNTASATGRTPDATVITDTTLPVTTALATPAPQLTATNAAVLAPGSTGIAGDTVQLSYSVRNTGDVTLSGTSLTDPAAGITGLVFSWPDPARPGVLPVGATATATATYLLTQADIDSGAYVNTIAAAGAPPTGADATATAVSTLTLAADPVLVIEKSGAPRVATETGVGDTVDWSFTVTNRGNVTLTEVEITDTLQGLSGIVYSWPGVAGRLAPDQSVTARASSVFIQDDIDAGRAANSASVSGTPPSGIAVLATSALATVPTEAALPSIATTKSGRFTTGTGDAGSVITYTFAITNTGNVTLRLVGLSDALAGVSRPVLTFPGTTGVVLPGATATGTATYTLTQADLESGSVVNVATASGTAPDGTIVSGSSPPSTVGTAPALPAIRTTQTAALAAGATGVVGDLVEYSYSIVNSGNVALSGVTLANSLGAIDGLVITWPATAGTLARGATATATATHTITQADVDAGVVLNTATSRGTPPTGAGVTGVSPQTSVTLAAAAPALSIVKSGATPGTGSVGEQVTWSFTVRNEGTVTLTGVGIDDALPGLSAITFGPWPATVGVLAPGGVVTATATSAITQADVDRGSARNTATARGLPPTGPLVRQVSDEAVVATVAATSGISLTKQQTLAAGSIGRAGDIVTYSFTVANLGNTTLRGVGVVDGQPGLSTIAYAWPGAAGVLAPGQSVIGTATHALTQAEVDAGGISSEATAAGVTPVPAAVTATVSGSTVLVPAPSITLDLRGSFETIAQQGKRIAYDYTVTNTGTTTLTGVTITDLLPGLDGLVYTWPADAGTLAPGQSATARAYYTITQADIDRGSVQNSAGVLGTPPTGAGTSVTATDTETLLTPSRNAISLTSGVSVRDGRAGFPGDILDFTYLATNTGTSTLTNVRITDPRTGLSVIEYLDWPGEVGVLLPGQSVRAKASWVIPAGSLGDLITSTATVSSTEIVTGVGVLDVSVVSIQLPSLPVVPPSLPGVPPLLAFTGSDPTFYLGGGILLLLSGLVLMLAARPTRRKEGA